MSVPTSPSNGTAYISEIDESRVDFLRSYRVLIDWQFEKHRLEYLSETFRVIHQWKSQQILDLGTILQPGEILFLLLDCVNHRRLKEWGSHDVGSAFIDCVAKSSYRALPPKLDRRGRPMLLRRTMVHRAAKADRWELVGPLLDMYDRFDVNYIDVESGLTHYHIACMAGLASVERFIEQGQDPNGLVLTRTDDSPLHLALDYKHSNKAIEILLRRGADPNSVNAKGETPLHVVCKGPHDARALTKMFKICDELHLQVRVNARDNMGNTPLQLAIKSLKLDVVQFLWEREGVDKSGLVFPTERDLDERVASHAGDSVESKLKLIPDVVGLVYFLEAAKDFHLGKRDVLAIMKFFIKLGVYMLSVELSEEAQNIEWEMVNFRRKLIKEKVGENLSFYKLIQSGVHAASRHFTYSDFKTTRQLFGYYHPCDIYVNLKICEIMLRGLFLHHATNFFMEMTDCLLPRECYDMVINENFTNHNLYSICLAAADESDRENGEIDEMRTGIDNHYVHYTQLHNQQ